METHTQIEDIIDANKESGQYDVLINNLKPHPQGQNVNTRYAYSAPTGPMDEVRDEFIYNNKMEGDNIYDNLIDSDTIGQSDSEITLIRVKRESSSKQTTVSNWDMPDKAIPGDGTHLGESSSMVNLVTLITKQNQKSKNIMEGGEQQEFMVPLSSWEPSSPRELTPRSEEDCLKEDSAQEVAKQPDLNETKSSSSFKELFKCMMFWKRGPQNEDGLQW